MLSISIIKMLFIVILIIAIIIAIVKKLFKLFATVLVVLILFTGYFMIKYNMTLGEVVTQYKQDISYGVVASKDIKNIADDFYKISDYSKQENKAKEIDACIADTEKSSAEIKKTAHSKALDKYTSQINDKIDSVITLEKDISKAYKVKDNEKVKNSINQINETINSIK